MKQVPVNQKQSVQGAQEAFSLWAALMDDALHFPALASTFQQQTDTNLPSTACSADARSQNQARTGGTKGEEKEKLEKVTWF